MKVNRNVSVSRRFICIIFLIWQKCAVEISIWQKCAVKIVSFLIEDSIIRTLIQKFNFPILTCTYCRALQSSVLDEIKHMLWECFERLQKRTILYAEFIRDNKQIEVQCLSLLNCMHHRHLKSGCWVKINGTCSWNVSVGIRRLWIKIMNLELRNFLRWTFSFFMR